MKKCIFMMITGLFFLSVWAIGTYAQEIYQWVDEKGEIHYTDDLGQVPEKYRDQIQEKKIRKESTPPETLPPSPDSSVNTQDQQKPLPSTIEKDALDRGEDWWRAQVQGWRDKLENAQKGLEETQNTLTAKEKELEENKTRSIFHRTRVTEQLKKDIANLQEKEIDLQKQIEEAKNMLEKVLPRDAVDYRANPDWLK